jgi:hypothetical protein
VLWDRFAPLAGRTITSMALAVDAQGDVMAGFPDGNLRSFDGAGGEPRSEVVAAIPETISRIAFTGNRMCVLGWDGRLDVWNQDRRLVLAARVALPEPTQQWPFARIAADVSRVVVTVPGGSLRAIPLRRPRGVADTAASKFDSDAARIAEERIARHGTSVEEAAAGVRADPTIAPDLAARAGQIIRRMDVVWFRYCEAILSLTIDRRCTKEQADRAVVLGRRFMEITEPGTAARAVGGLCLGVALLRSGADAEAEAVLREADDVLVTNGDYPGESHTIAAVRAIAAMKRGRTEEARALLAEARRRFQLLGLPPHEQTMDLAIEAVEGAEK